MKKDTENRLGKRLRELRTAGSYCQAEVAAEIGVVRQTYSNYENGLRVPDHETLYKLAGFYGITVEDLMHLSVALDPEEYYDAPGQTKSSSELAEYLEYYNRPENVRDFRHFSNDEKRLIFYFRKLARIDREEVVAITRLKAQRAR